MGAMLGRWLAEDKLICSRISVSALQLFSQNAITSFEVRQPMAARPVKQAVSRRRRARSSGAPVLLAVLLQACGAELASRAGAEIAHMAVRLPDRPSGLRRPRSKLAHAKHDGSADVHPSEKKADRITPCRGGCDVDVQPPSSEAAIREDQANHLTVTVIKVDPADALDPVTVSSFTGAQEVSPSMTPSPCLFALQVNGVEGGADLNLPQIATISLSEGPSSTVENLFGMLGLSPSLYTVSFTGQVINYNPPSYEMPRH